MSNGIQIIDLTPENIGDYGVCGYKDAGKHKELRNKIAWFSDYYPKGLRIKALLAEDGSYQGMIEYLPGRFAHRPVNADGYLFIHCVFVGFRSEFKGKGYATQLIEACLHDAKAQELLGVAVVTRKGSFMAGKEIFLKNGFEVVDKARPDFELLVFKFDKAAKSPAFNPEIAAIPDRYSKGLTILRSAQCPYTEKNVKAIIDSAERKFHLKAELIDLNDSDSAQTNPCAFGTFCILYNGEIISYHPISNTRFENIMNQKLSGV